VLVRAPASIPALKPYSSPKSLPKTRLKATAVIATTHARVTYRIPSAAKALKKAGPAWMPTEKMNRANPKPLAPGGALKPTCPNSRATSRTPMTGPAGTPAIRILATR
jgi:hypothetical protein